MKMSPSAGNKKIQEKATETNFCPRYERDYTVHLLRRKPFFVYIYLYRYILVHQNNTEKTIKANVKLLLKVFIMDYIFII